MDGILDAHYFMLPTQSNIYSLARLPSVSGSVKLLVACLKKKVFCLEYSSDKENVLIPVIRDISFTYIPSGAEIISIDAFNKSKEHDDFVVGIAIIKTANSDAEPEKYLNIYSEAEPDESNDINLDNLANNCFMIELDFVPYFLYHSMLHDLNKIVWLLSGSDSKIHLYIEDFTTHTYHETDIKEHFPELASPSSIVIWMDIQYSQQNTRRLSVIGCEDWSVKVSLVDVQTKSLLRVYNYDSDGPISKVHFFSFSRDLNSNLEDCAEEKEEEEDEERKEVENLHLLVTSTLNQSVVFMNVNTSGISQRHFLPYKDSYDAVLSSVCADIDLDGSQEIILGTYSQELLLHKFNGSSWELVGTRGVSSSVLCLEYLDLSQDGIKELAVVTMRGIHIFQHDPNIILQKLKESTEFSKTLAEVAKLETNPGHEGHLIDLINFYIDSKKFFVAQKKAAEYHGNPLLRQSLGWHKCLITLYKLILEKSANDGEDQQEETDYLVGAVLVQDNYLSILHRSQNDNSLEETKTALKLFDVLLWKMCNAPNLASAADLFVKRHFLAQLSFHIAVVLLKTAKEDDGSSKDETISLCSLALLFAQASPFSSATSRSLLLGSRYRGRTKHLLDSAIFRVIQANLTLRTWSASTSSDEFTIRTHPVSEEIRQRIFSIIFSKSEFNITETSCWLTAKEFCRLPSRLSSIPDMITKGNLLSYQRQCADSLHDLVWLGVQLLIQNIAEKSEYMIPSIFNFSFLPRIISYFRFNEKRTIKLSKVDFDSFLILSVFCAYFHVRNNKPPVLLSNAMPNLPTNEQCQFWSALKASQENELKNDFALIFIQGLDTVRLSKGNGLDPELSVSVARTLQSLLTNDLKRQSPEDALILHQRVLWYWNYSIEQLEMLREKQMCATSVNMFFPHQSKNWDKFPSEIDKIIEEGLLFVQQPNDSIDPVEEKIPDNQRYYPSKRQGDGALSTCSSTARTLLDGSQLGVDKSFKTCQSSSLHRKSSESESSVPEQNVEALVATNSRLTEVIEKLAKRLENLESLLPSSKYSDSHTDDENQARTPPKPSANFPYQLKDEKDANIYQPLHSHPPSAALFPPYSRSSQNFLKPVAPVSPHYQSILPPGYYPTSPMYLPHELPPVHSHRMRVHNVNPGMFLNGLVHYKVPPPDPLRAPPIFYYASPGHHLNSRQSQASSTPRSSSESNFECQSLPTTPQSSSTRESPVSQEYPLKNAESIKSGAPSPPLVQILPEEVKSKNVRNSSVQVPLDSKILLCKDSSNEPEILFQESSNELDFSESSSTPVSALYTPNQSDSSPSSMLNPNAITFNPDSSDDVHFREVGSDPKNTTVSTVSALSKFHQDANESSKNPNHEVSTATSGFLVSSQCSEFTDLDPKTRTDVNANHKATRPNSASLSKCSIDHPTVYQSSLLSLQLIQDEDDQRWVEAAKKVGISVSKKRISEAAKNSHLSQTKSTRNEETSVRHTNGTANDTSSAPCSPSSESCGSMAATTKQFDATLPKIVHQQTQHDGNAVFSKLSPEVNDPKSVFLKASQVQGSQDQLISEFSKMASSSSSVQSENHSELVISNDHAIVVFDEPCKWSRSQFFSPTMKWIDKLLDNGRIKIIFDPDFKSGTLLLERSKIFGASITQHLSKKLKLDSLNCSSRAWIWNYLDSDRKIIVQFESTDLAQKLLSAIEKVQSLICEPCNENSSESSEAKTDHNGIKSNANSSCSVSDLNETNSSTREDDETSTSESLADEKSQSGNCESFRSSGSTVFFGQLKNFEFNAPSLRPDSESSTEKSISKDNCNSSGLLGSLSEASMPSKIVLTTGEENETALFRYPAILFRFKDGEWKERGIGDFKLLLHRTEGHFRFVMRRKPIDVVCLNHLVTKDLVLSSKDSRSWSWTALDFSDRINCDMSKKIPDIFSVRFETADIAKKFKSAVDFCLASICSHPQKTSDLFAAV